MNGFAALDIHPHRRYVVDIGGRRSCRCRLHINFALFLRSLDFTQNLGVTRKLVHLKHYPTRAAVQDDVFVYLEAFYNTIRPHSALGWLSPASFEAELAASAA